VFIALAIGNQTGTGDIALAIGSETGRLLSECDRGRVTNAFIVQTRKLVRVEWLAGHEPFRVRTIAELRCWPAKARRLPPKRQLFIGAQIG
jgi:hypothetical protein